MTTDHDDLERIVRRTLAAQAGRADGLHDDADDLAGRAISRGRVVRRRRQVGGAVAAGFATLAVAGGVWSVFAPQQGQEAMPATQATTAAAPAAVSPAGVVPRVDRTASGVVLRLPSRTVTLPASVRSVRQVLPAGTAVVVLGSDRPSAGAAGGTQTLLRVPAAGEPVVLASGAITSAAVSADGAKVAYVGGAAGSGALLPRVREVASGQLVAAYDNPAAGGSYRVSAWDGADVLVETALDGGGSRLYRWAPGGDLLPQEGFARAVAVPGGAPLVVGGTPAGGGDCLRRSGSTTDLACGVDLQASVSPDGRQALVHTLTNEPGRGGPVEDRLARVDLTTGKATNLTVPKDLRRGAGRTPGWGQVAWTTSGTPLLPVASAGATQWRSVDLRTGATTPRPLPDGATATITW